MLTNHGRSPFNLGEQRHNNNNNNITTTINNGFSPSSLQRRCFGYKVQRYFIVRPTASSLVDGLTSFVTLGGWPLHSITGPSLT